MNEAAEKKTTTRTKKEPVERPAHEFAKSSNVVRDVSMGGSVIMTAKEYAEYSDANGRYQGRKKDEVTELNTGELRIAIKQVQMGKATPSEMRKHLMDKHGISEYDIAVCAVKITKEEETTVPAVLKPLGIDPKVLRDGK